MTQPAAMPHVMNTYGRLPFALSHGRGSRVWDTDGREYLDALGGIAVNTLGHAHPALVAAIADQAGKLIHSSNYYQVPLQETLAAMLCERSGPVVGVLLLDRPRGQRGRDQDRAQVRPRQGRGSPEIIVCERAFHGRSLATLSATGNPKIQAGFGPLVEGFVRVPFNDAAAVREIAKTHKNVVAVMLEPVQGEGGINPARNDYLRELRAVCDEQGWLLMLDEVQCGIARTGKWFAYQWAGIQPDVMSLAKGLGSGVPGGRAGGGRAREGRVRAGQPRHHVRRQPAGDARRRRDAEGDRVRRPDEERRRRRRAPARRVEARAGRRRRLRRGARRGPDDRRRAGQAVRRDPHARGRGRPAAERHRRHGDPPRAAADLHDWPMPTRSSPSWRR